MTTSNNYFISDTHFGHANVIQYSNRPFVDVQDMDAAMIDRWNSVVKKDDNVYHLGDFAFSSEARIEEILKQLNGKKYLIFGNHDKKIRNSKHLQSLFEGGCHEMLEVSIQKQRIVLCHFGMRVWNGVHYGAWHLYGHSHGNLPGDAQCMDVGVDTGNGFRPYSFDQIKELFNIIKDIRPHIMVDHHS